MIQKPNSSPVEVEGHPPPPYLKMARLVRLNIRSVLVILLAVGVLFVCNLLLQAELLTSITTKRFWNYWGSGFFFKNIQNNGVAPGFGDWPWKCTRLLKRVSPPVFGSYNRRCGPHSPNLPQMSPCNFFLFLRMKFSAVRVSFSGLPWNLGIITDCPTCSSKNSVLLVLPALAEMLDSFKLGRGVLWMGQQWPVISVCIYFGINSVWDLPDTPLCGAN